MGKNQITTKNTTQSQGVCEKIFRAVNISPAFRSFRRISPQNPRFATTNSATTDHHRNYTAKATISKPVALHQNGSTIPLQLNSQQIPSQEKYQNLSSDSNMVLEEYNHSSGDSAIPNFKADKSLKPVNKFHANISTSRDHRQKQDPYNKGTKVEPVKNMVTILHHQINEGPKDENDRFSDYIDHVKNKMRTMSSFDDDKVSHYIDRSKFKIGTTTIAGGNQGAA
ncbi:hypothetical protein K7X08_011076 [Anisodus acutangulus]|uniref:Uncharacterized protein n=2 Tax=Anisodus TaxID=243963 RepID=A0A9Q1RBI5_9SOLA|nr:hypothetical protein K7X08_011076 [Anisodus acutangulus]KAK4357337.1 hypothetical protein RND71_022947 [Anisodus tanguticus]